MSPEEGYGEVVWIKDAYRLIDSEGCERTYGADDARNLEPGFYVAHWPAGTKNPHFLHDGLTFVGPYRYRHSALALLGSELPAAHPACANPLAGLCRHVAQGGPATPSGTGSPRPER
jgi:hypothetical protein